MGALNENIRDSINALHSVLVPTDIQLPTKNQAIQEARLFAEAGGDNGTAVPNLVMWYVLQWCAIEITR